MFLKKSSLVELKEELRKSGSSLLQSIDTHMERYHQVEPHLQAFVPDDHLDHRLKYEAENLMINYPNVENRPPLFGIPVAIKDLLHVDGLLTRAGSNLPAAQLTGQEGSLVARLRSLGALIAGKTVTEEFAYAGPIATRNPHHIDYSPGGSSAGSAAAVAAGIVPLAIGTQTLRSVTAPASFCGVVGFKPSHGRVPLDGVILLSPSFDTVGFFTQDMDSMEYAAVQLVPDWTPYQSDRKPMLGIPNGVYMNLMYDEVKDRFREQIRVLEESGFVVRQVDMPWEDDFIVGDAMLRLVQGEMAQVHETWFDSYSDCYGSPVRQGILSGREVKTTELEQYRRGQRTIRERLKEIKRKAGIDMWVSPAQGGLPPKWGEGTGWSGMTAIWSYAGCPTISLPSVQKAKDCLPLGFQCIGDYGEDEKLLYWSKQFSI
ncbi:amidase [Paenibacillaceae bacterium]|nr:amidase [Paenibacillaceae bacterium]